MMEGFEDLLTLDNPEIYFPDFLSYDRYNDTIRKTDTEEKFQDILNQLAEDEKVTPSRLITLTEMMVRDLELVHNNSVFPLYLCLVQTVVSISSLTSKKT